ncbi:MAG: Tol-Pal system beta propeller repeat protein TolB [Rickettsiaceae bacterium]|nr:Tol-Pal system beta propeller repeat protein TolB [Rickettsiaceae bacterium]
MKNFFITLILSLYSLNSSADVVRISSGHIDPIPVAINNFSVSDSETADIAQDILKVVTNDLNASGVFRPISHAAFIESKTGIDHRPLFAAWQQINANLLINGEITRTITQKLQIKFILWDTILEKEMLSETFELQEDLWRRAAHKISDGVYKKITGYEGYFNTKIAYVSEDGAYLKRTKRLAIMDYDGANHKYLTDGSDLVLTPRFSPDGKYLLYLSYKNGAPQVHMLSIRTGQTKLIGTFKGMSFAPRFSPDGTHALMSIAKDGATHIYEINLKTRKLWQLTSGAGINTSPSYSPDGSKIAYNSDASGARQILVMDRNGANKKRISFGGGVYAEPTWSSRDYLAYTKINRELGFTIGVMRPDIFDQKNTERLITSGYLVESPSWAANGRVLLFTKGQPARNGKKKGFNRIYTIDFTGHNERIIPTPHDASDPDWSRPID